MRQVPGYCIKAVCYSPGKGNPNKCQDFALNLPSQSLIKASLERIRVILYYLTAPGENVCCSLKEYNKIQQCKITLASNLKLLGMQRIREKTTHSKGEKNYQKQIQGLTWWHSGEDSVLPMQGAGVLSLVRELDPHACCNKSLHASEIGRAHV